MRKSLFEILGFQIGFLICRSAVIKKCNFNGNVSVFLEINYNRIP